MSSRFSSKVQPAVLRKRANELLYDFLAKLYFDFVPIGQMLDVCRSAGYEVDPDEESMILTGRDGRASVPLIVPGYPDADVGLHLTWHKMEMSGRYEVVAYVN